MPIKASRPLRAGDNSYKEKKNICLLGWKALASGDCGGTKR